MRAVAYSEAEKVLVEQFDNLPDEDKHGYWKKTENELAPLKKSIKDHYLREQDFTCPYCQQRVEIEHLGVWDAEHIVDKDSHPHFMFTPENLCVSCKDCNNAKLNKNVLVNRRLRNYPMRDDAFLIHHPHFGNYERDIKIVKLAGFYLPKTEKGRVTVETCGLLRFLYKYTNYEAVPAEIEQRISHVTSALMETDEPMVKLFYLSLLAKLASEGLKIRREEQEKILFAAKP